MSRRLRMMASIRLFRLTVECQILTESLFSRKLPSKILWRWQGQNNGHVHLPSDSLKGFNTGNGEKLNFSLARPANWQ